MLLMHEPGSAPGGFHWRGRGRFRVYALLVFGICLEGCTRCSRDARGSIHMRVIFTYGVDAGVRDKHVG
jgi:hypothetical protein